MISRWISAVGVLVAIDGAMLPLYLTCNVLGLFVSFTPVGSPATIVSLFTAVQLARLPRERFIARRAVWSKASVAQVQALSVASVALHLVSSVATLLAVWFAMPYARPIIPLIASIAVATAVAAGIWGWFSARKRWGEYGLW